MFYVLLLFQFPSRNATASLYALAVVLRFYWISEFKAGYIWGSAYIARALQYGEQGVAARGRGLFGILCLLPLAQHSWLAGLRE